MSVVVVHVPTVGDPGRLTSDLGATPTKRVTRLGERDGKLESALDLWPRMSVACSSVEERLWNAGGSLMAGSENAEGSEARSGGLLVKTCRSGLGEKVMRVQVWGEIGYAGLRRSESRPPSSLHSESFLIAGVGKKLSFSTIAILARLGLGSSTGSRVELELPMATARLLGDAGRPSSRGE